MELITVIIPIYKAEQYLDRCIASVIQQTYKNLEIILVDDGSPDGCPEICDKWREKDGRIKVIHQENSGVSISRNTGISNAKGEYIVFIDSDDYICAGMIEKMYQNIKSSATDMVVCDFEKGFCDKFEFTFSADSNVEIIDNVTALKRIYQNADMALQYVAPWGKLYKKQLFEDIVYPKGKIFEDIYITHKLLFKCDKIAVLQEKMVYYYQHPESIMNRKLHIKKLDYLQALKERIEFYKHNNLDELAQIAYDEYLHSLIWEYSRARDILQDPVALKDIVSRFREIYVKGYASKRYPNDSKLFLYTFSKNSERIILYWKVKGKLEKIFNR